MSDAQRAELLLYVFQDVADDRLTDLAKRRDRGELSVAESLAMQVIVATQIASATAPTHNVVPRQTRINVGGDRFQ